MTFHRIIAAGLILLSAQTTFSAQREDAELAVTAQSMEQHLNQGEFAAAVSEGMPAYRQLARRKYGVQAMHTYARNFVITHRAARQTRRMLSAAHHTDPGKPRRLLKPKAFFKSLSYLGEVQRFPAIGLTVEEQQFLTVLHTATVQLCDVSVLKDLESVSTSNEPGSAAYGYYIAYLLASRDRDQCEETLGALPDTLQTAAILGQFATSCANMERKDIAATVCLRGAEAIRDEEASVSFCNRAAGFYLDMNDVSGAVKALKRIVTTFPESKHAPEAQAQIIDIIAARWKAYGTAVRECQVFLDRFPDSERAEAMRLRIGHLLYQNRDYDGAIEYLRGLAKNSSGDTGIEPVRFLLAFCYMAKGDSETAEEILEELVTEHSDHPLAPRAQYVLAKAYLSRQEYAGAQAELRQLIRVHPNSEYSKRASDLLQKLSQVVGKNEPEE